MPTTILVANFAVIEKRGDVGGYGKLRKPLYFFNALNDSQNILTDTTLKRLSLDSGLVL